ncbi:anti-sigma factor antagonist [Streptomyces viridiviolaceus]|uniref:Anti-sigma factor antagonist n=1 Tax=Streptomyces viridiviolaceus TaxID=68282 RepID=A0ABW2EAL2_9ACTN|nr:STAS domain-containing protein [Streptomyces viridiviolaceus]GHB69784.1 anti-sigma factor antagonist [Streptomyces viridiviolaceus]
MRTPKRHTLRNDKLDHCTTNGWTVVSVTGEVDVCSSPAIREAVDRLIDGGHKHFVLDLCHVTFLDSMGLGMIVAITKRLQACAGSLLLTCADARILKVFKAGGLYPVYAFHDSVADATRDAPEVSGLAGWPYSHT